MDAIAPVPAQHSGDAPARQRDLPFAELMRRVEGQRKNDGNGENGGEGDGEGDVEDDGNMDERGMNE